MTKINNTVNYKIIVVGASIALLSMSLGTVGFSLLELEQRSATVEVAAEDPNGLLSLQPGASSVVKTNNNGVLEINLGDQLGSASGMNPQARLELGDGTAATPEAFSATNGYSKDVQVDLTVENLQLPSDGSGGTAGTVFLYQDGTEYNLSQDTVPQITLTPGETVSYSLHFDTQTPASADAFNADLTFRVNEA